MGDTYLSGRVELVQGDITTLAVDAIVNAANRGLLGGGGVDGAIHRAAGPELLEACRKLHGCEPGGARITEGFRLPAKWVIHAVGPRWKGGQEDEAALLGSAYLQSLMRAEEVGAASVAFPAISTGSYGYPLRPATRIALTTVRDWLAQHDVPARVVLCTYLDRDLAAYRELADEVLG